MVAARGPRARYGDVAPRRVLQQIRLNGRKNADLSAMHICKLRIVQNLSATPQGTLCELATLTTTLNCP